MDTNAAEQGEWIQIQIRSIDKTEPEQKNSKV